MIGIGGWEVLILLALCVAPLVIVAVALLFVFALRDRVTGPTKKCPFCAETIRAEAVVCRYCGRDVPAEPLAGEPANLTRE